MNSRFLFLFAVLTTVFASCASVEKLQKTPIGLVNNVSYVNSEFDNPNASNGFLVKYDNVTYGITAKHVLLISKSENMKFVDFEGELKEWRMHPKDDSTSYVSMGKLLNPNRKDSLTWSYLDSNWDTYDDWLVFSVKENNAKHKPLPFRTTPLAKGEQLFIVGWSYGDKTGSQRVYEYTYETTEGNYLNLIQTKGPKSLGGLSGSPVVDIKGHVVGLVTSGWEDEETKVVRVEATSTDHMLEFLGDL
ncbi:MAG: serine protease [Saprospiraceae bacterium]